MSRRHAALGLALAFSIVFSFGCGGSTKDTRAQDESAIRAADMATLKAAQTKNIEGVIANYADDASWLPPNAPIANGKTAIRAGWSQLIGNPGFNIDWRINRMEVARGADLA